MYLKITRSGPRRYLQIVEAYRDPETRQPRQRHVATLGRLDQLKGADLDALINGLLALTQRPDLTTLNRRIEAEHTTFETALQLGEVWALTGLWHQLQLVPALTRSFQRPRQQVDLEPLVRVLVFNRLSDPCSKLGVLRWLERVYLPAVERKAVTHQRLLRAMDALIAHKDALERHLTATLAPQFAPRLEVVFYDLTTVRVHAEGEDDDALRRYGYSKDLYGTDRQFAVGVVQTAEGLPITHDVFPGNVSEVGTVEAVVRRLCERFPIRRLVWIADRAMLSVDNLEALDGLRLAEGRAVEYIVAVPARRCTRLTEPLAVLHPRLVRESRRRGEESIAEAAMGAGRRLIVAHDPVRARQQRRHRAKALRQVLKLAYALEAKLNAQEAGQARRGRQLTDQGAKLKLQQAVAERHLSGFIQVDADGELFSWSWQPAAWRQAWQRDGKLVLITNVTDLDAPTVVRRYKALADIERGFRVLKSELEIAPVHHRLPQRIRAHTLICFLALVLHRVLRHRLRQQAVALSPGAVLDQIKAIQYHTVRLSTGQRLSGISRLTAEHRSLFQAIGVEVPTPERLSSAM